MKKCKDAFTLTECILYIFVFQVIMFIGSIYALKVYETYNNAISGSMLDNSVNNTFLFIKRECTSEDVFKIENSSKKLSIYSEINTEIYELKEIYLNNKSKVVVASSNVNKHTLDETKMNVSILLEDIKSLEFISKGKLIYINIQTSDNRENIICI